MIAPSIRLPARASHPAKPRGRPGTSATLAPKLVRLIRAKRQPWAQK